MNLRVDLILPTEQRSASVINVKSLVRIAIIVVPLIVVLAIALGVVNMMQSRGDLDRLKTQWKETEPQKQAAAKLRTQLADNLALEKKVSGWAGSRTMWDQQLRGIQRELPPEARIQLTRLNLGSPISVAAGKVPVRTGLLVLQGAAYGENSEANVQTFRQALVKSPALAALVEKVEVTRFDANPKAGKFDRVFQIDITYKARKFE